MRLNVPLAHSLAALALCAAPLLAQANCTSPNTDDNYILGDADGTASAMHWETGLVWKRCLEGQSFNGSQCTGSGTTKDWNVWAETDGLLPQSFTGQDSLGISVGFTQNLLHSGDWRMAYQAELKKITDSCADDPKLNSVVFPNDPALYVWSGSPNYYYPNYAQGVIFRYGSSFVGVPSISYLVRLVRGGQSFDDLTSPAAQTVAANAQASFDPITLIPIPGGGQTWGGVRISGDGNPEFQVNGGDWVKEAIVKSGDTLIVRLTAPAAGSHTATLKLRSGQTTGSSASAGNEYTEWAETTADFTLNALAAPTTAQPIPTLGEWAMLLMAGLLGLLGAGVLRRQRTQQI